MLLPTQRRLKDLGKASLYNLWSSQEEKAVSPCQRFVVSLWAFDDCLSPEMALVLQA